MRRRPGRAKPLGRDAAIALVLALLGALAIVLALTGRARGDARTSVLPPGWHAIDRPITGVVYPRQVFAAATYPVGLRQRPRSCTPVAALRRMPAGGVLVQIIEYAPRAAGHSVRVPSLPLRPNRFTYADADYGRFECAGPSFKFVYRQAGRALQAQVWMKRGTVNPRSRAEALRILDRFTPADSSAGKRD